MIDQAARTLTLHQAAQVICRTPKPTAEQLNRVRTELESGALKGRNDPKLGWTTTGALVAEYMARRQLHKERAKRDAAEGKTAGSGSGGAAPTAEHYRGEQELKPVYRDILKDYFLTVLMRRRLGHQSFAFKASVLAGQFLLLSVLIGGMVWGVKVTLIPQPPEQKAVQAYLEMNFPGAKIHEWGPSLAVPGGTSVSVKFRYKPPNAKGVETERTFFVSGQRVVPVTERDED